MVRINLEAHLDVLVDLVGPLNALLFWNPYFLPNVLQSDVRPVEIGHGLRSMDLTRRKAADSVLWISYRCSHALAKKQMTAKFDRQCAFNDEG